MCIKFANHPFHIITNQTNIMPPRKRGGIMFYRIFPKALRCQRSAFYFTMEFRNPAKSFCCLSGMRFIANSSCGSILSVSPVGSGFRPFGGTGSSVSPER